MTRFVLLSDTHGSHEDVVVPDGDILIHAGDFMGAPSHWPTLKGFAKWLGSLPHRRKIVIPGNHDGLLQMQPSVSKQQLLMYEGVDVLIHESLEVDGWRIFGSPWTPQFYNWFFMTETHADRQRLWSQIPDDTQILVTHGPPKDILDPDRFGRSVGDLALRDRVDQLRPRLHVFGHLHSGAGRLEGSSTTFVNASVMNDNYDVVHPPTVIDLP